MGNLRNWESDVPSFSWTGIFREGQWRAYRAFILGERQDASKRERVILAELDRIGYVDVNYEVRDGKATERRLGIEVTPLGCSLHKLLSAYVAMGGNPFDISMFLSPDDAVPIESGVSPQPSGGVSTSVQQSVSYGGGPTSADTSLRKYQPSRSGGPVITPDGPMGNLVQRSRKWATQEIKYKRNALEARILKLCDLREQLHQELVDLCWATRGHGISSEIYDSTRYDDDLTVAKIIYTIDSIFRTPSEDGSVPALSDPNLESLAVFPNLISDDPDEENSAC